MAPKSPIDPLPEPLRGEELGTFTHKSIVERLPRIGRRLLAVNAFPAAVAEALQSLVDGIPNSPIGPLDDNEAPDAAEWEAYIAPYLGRNWLEVPWFFVEVYFYRRILDISGYFREGPGRGVDPYAYDKRRGLEDSTRAIRELSERVKRVLGPDGRQRQALTSLLFAALWGNQADMSMWPAGTSEEETSDTGQIQAHTLVDDSAEVVAHLFDRPAPAERVDILLDNAGFELTADLHLAHYLLSHELARKVRLLAKVHPTFVSDALKDDVAQTMGFLAADADPTTAAIGQGLAGFMSDGRLALTDDWFWNSPLAAWQMSQVLYQDLAGADLLISKGDANYRRWLGDRHWPFTTPFCEVVGYTPAPLAALRTLKAEVMVGLTEEKLQAVGEADPGWLADGSWGVIQFCRPQTAG